MPESYFIQKRMCFSKFDFAIHFVFVASGTVFLATEGTQRSDLRVQICCCAAKVAPLLFKTAMAHLCPRVYHLCFKRAPACAMVDFPQGITAPDQLRI
jgi:hypothetical protein